MFSFGVMNISAQVRNPVPNTSKMVRESLARSRAKNRNRKPVRISIPQETLMKMFGICGVPATKDSVSAIKVDSTMVAAKQSLSKSDDNGMTALDLLNMIAPGTFSEKEKTAWKSLPKETRQAIIGTVLNSGPIQWDMLNDAQKAVIHEASNGK